MMLVNQIPCQCEHALHFEEPRTVHEHLRAPAGEACAMFVGPICDACVEHMKPYLLEGEEAEASRQRVAEMYQPGPIVTEEGATFTPWTDGRAVGYKITAEGKLDMYIYLNPSSETDTGEIEDSDVFVYRGDTGYADLDEPQCFVNVWDPKFLTALQRAEAEERRWREEHDADTDHSR